MPTVVFSNSTYFPTTIDRRFCRRFPEPIIIAASTNGGGGGSRHSSIFSSVLPRNSNNSLHLRLFRRHQNAGRKKDDLYSATFEITYCAEDRTWDTYCNAGRVDGVTQWITLKEVNNESLLYMINKDYPEVAKLVMFHQEILDGEYEPSESDIIYSSGGKVRSK